MDANDCHDIPLIAHIVFRLDYGGLENGVVNIVNRLPKHLFRHAVIALTDVTQFAERLQDDVIIECVGKRPGKDLGAYVRLFKLLRRLNPEVVHTRNLGTMECALVAFLAGVPVRIHGEHGWDVFDPDGTSQKYRWMRRLLSKFVTRFITVSEELQRWLVGSVGIAADKVQHICNGVDDRRFHPGQRGIEGMLPAELASRDIVIGSVTRFTAIKDPLNLVEAFIALCNSVEFTGDPPGLVMIGDGDLLESARSRLREAGLNKISWLPGSRDDIPEILRSLDLFVLGSMREGISNTILEAMATGLPVIATRTGGNVELVTPGETGELVAAQDPTALARGIGIYVRDGTLRLYHGRAARERVESRFSLGGMIDNYRAVYEGALTLRRDN